MNTNLYSKNEKFPQPSSIQNIYPIPTSQIFYQSNPQCIYTNPIQNGSNLIPTDSSAREINTSKLN